MLQHVGIEMRPDDVEAAIWFFELLGFRRVDPPSGLSQGFTWLEREGTQVHLLHEESPVAPPRGHLAVVVADFGAAVERLRAAGFEVKERRRHWGSARASALAPGGHRVELMAAPPAAPDR
jgi:catechol 2,3-dioxygenase-like lactoylglutathione lyase family enzyme